MSEYASHLPVLKSLSSLIPMRRVLEYGAGLYSTAFFLSLPDLERLVSVETDPDWYAKVGEAFEDRRHFLVRSREGTLEDFDLVFIDDGQNAAERVATIRTVFGQKHPPVVIHDAEVSHYRELIQAQPNNVLFTAEVPWTALTWG